MKFNLNQFLIKNLELKEKEVKIFILLFFHSFFIGWFIAFYFASANSEFILQFGSEQLPYAYIIAGIAGYLVSSFYSFIQKKINTKVLFSGALIFMFLITLVGRFGLNRVDIKWLSGFVFIWAWPFISLSGIELGGLAIRFLNLVQVKRLYGLFNMGGVIAAILSYFAIPLLKPVISHLYDLLIIGALGLIVSIYLLFRLYKQDVDNEETTTSESKSSNITLKSILKEKYFLWIFASATLSMTMIYLADFGFLASVKINISAENVAQYLAIVYGGLKVGEMIVSYYSRRLLATYGVKLALTILPITTSIIMVLAAIWGNLFGVGIVFLIFMTLTKSLERILRRGLDDPGFNVLYQPLADDQKIAIQSRVGVVMQFSIAIAGGILLFMNYLLMEDGQMQLEYFPLFFLPVLLLWVFVAIKLYGAYKERIRQILAEISKDKRRGTDQYQYGSEILRKHLKAKSFFSVYLSATTLSEVNPKIMEAYASNLIKEAKNPYFLKVVTQNIDPSWRRRLSKNIEAVLKRDLPPEVERSVIYTKNNLDYSNLKDAINEQEIEELMLSGKVGAKLQVIKYINKRIFEPSEELLLKLLGDEEKIVKISTINLSPSVKSNRVVKAICEYLRESEYRHIVANALLDIGSRALPFLDDLFKTSQDIDVLLKILEIYAKIGNDEAKTLLVNNLNYPSKDVQTAVIFALFYCKYQAEEESQIQLIRQKLEEVIDNILWIYATMLDIEGHHNTLRLFLALDQEKEANLNTIFLLLSFLYEPRIITLIQKNIIGKDTIFALEIMDNFFDSDIKKLITPIFDDITLSQKLKRLNHIFPQKRMTLVDRLKDVIMQDYSRLDSWTMAKAIELLGKFHKKRIKQIQKNNDFVDYSDIKIWKRERVMVTLEKIKRSEIPDEVFVALYHTDELVYTTAAKIIFDENPIKCFDYLANMSLKKQDLMNLLSNNEPLVDERIKYLKRLPLFFNIPENVLALLSKVARVKMLKVGQELKLYENEVENIFFVVKGKLKFSLSDGTEKIFSKNNVVIRGLNIDSFATKLIAETECLVIYFKRVDFFNTLISRKDIVRHVFADSGHHNWLSE